MFEWKGMTLPRVSCTLPSVWAHADVRLRVQSGSERWKVGAMGHCSSGRVVLVRWCPALEPALEEYSGDDSGYTEF